MKSNIRKLRNERNLSQTELAEVIGKTQQTVSHMEKDRDRISIESLITLADYFGVTTDYILGVEEEKPAGSSEKSRFADPEEIPKAAENIGRINDENRKYLSQLILSLLLYSLGDVPVEVTGS